MDDLDDVEAEGLLHFEAPHVDARDARSWPLRSFLALVFVVLVGGAGWALADTRAQLDEQAELIDVLKADLIDTVAELVGSKARLSSDITEVAASVDQLRDDTFGFSDPVFDLRDQLHDVEAELRTLASTVSEWETFQIDVDTDITQIERCLSNLSRTSLLGETSDTGC